MSAPADRAEMLYRRLLPDGREIVVYPLTYGRARIVVGAAESMVIDDGY